MVQVTYSICLVRRIIINQMLMGRGLLHTPYETVPVLDSLRLFCPLESNLTNGLDVSFAVVLRTVNPTPSSFFNLCNGVVG